MEDNYNEITEMSLKRRPFSLFFGNNKLPIDQIYSASNGFQTKLDEFKISNKSYTLEFSKKNQYECEMSILSNKAFIFSSTLYYKALTLNLDDLNLSTKKIFLYSQTQVKLMISCFKDKYEFYGNDNLLLENDKNYESLKEISVIRKIEFDVENKKFLEAKEKIKEFLKNLSENKSETIEINTLLLSFNFYSIFPDHSKNKPFILILNDERKKFLKILDNFVVSENKKFLWVVGADGIGKTVSFMYYSLISNGNVIYINLKLLNKNSKEMKVLFINDIIRYYYFKNRNQDGNTFANSKQELLETIHNIFQLSQEENEIEPKYKFWIYLRNLIAELSVNYTDLQIIIILDQYRDINIDYNYKYINNFIEYIYFKKRHKIIISTSINNYDIQSNFFNNVDIFNFNSNDEESDSNDSELEDINNINKEEYDVTQECEFYERILSKNEQENMVEKNPETISVLSNLALNNTFKDFTLKIYYSSLVSGKILTKDFPKEEQICFQNFNYNLKYIYLREYKVPQERSVV